MDLIHQPLFMGIEIGGTKLQLIVGASATAIIDTVKYMIKPEEGAAKIREQIEQGAKKLLLNNKVQAIGVGFGGPVDWKTGRIELSHQIEGWSNFDLKAWLQQFIKVAVSIDNDANTAALAEARHGCGKGHHSVFYMTIGSGIGGGLIINGKIYHGRKPGEVEVGHLRLDKNGTTLEDACSGWAVNKKIKDFIKKNPESVLSKVAAKTAGPEAHFLTPALQQNDAEAIAIVNNVADDIAFALSHVVHLINPDVIVIGGGLSLLNEYLSNPINEKLPRYLMKALLPAPPVKIASLREDVVPIGALELAKAELENHNQ